MKEKEENPESKLVAKVLASLDDATALARMRTLGFWPEGAPLPADPLEETKQRVVLEHELAALVVVAQSAASPEKALQKERIRRWKESQARRAEKKKERAAQAKARGEAWAGKRAGAFVHAGLGVSGGLDPRVPSDFAELGRRGLPIWHDAKDVAAALGISIARLRWLTYHRHGATLVHYHRYGIPKKTGGIRAISAPKPALDAAQRAILEKVLAKLAPSEVAHGFVAERSVVSNASPHVGRAVVVNLDLRDFFPSISFRRVKGLFQKLGYNEHVSVVLALLVTEPPRVPALLDGKSMHVALGERVLPQGACTSPAITNAICRRLDARLGGIARALGYRYTRYADDLTFSGDDPQKLAPLLGVVRKAIVSEGFVEHGDKTRVMRKGARQEVTGVVVNRKLSLPREERRALRALLENCARHGLASQNREEREDFPAYLRGKVAWACMVDPTLRAKLLPALERALAGPR